VDRAGWLAERRAAVVSQYDAEAPGYDAHDYPRQAQEEWVARLLAGLTGGADVLDAPCGTGRYFPLVAAAGLRVTGVDQSAGMLAQARKRGIAVALEQRSLADLRYREEFDAVLTIDAMENVPPEDWPVVLGNLAAAVRPAGPLYLTVEEIADADIGAAYAELSSRGVPAVRGEVIEGDVAGYHYYPGRARVLGWLAQTGLEVVAEDYTPADGWGYRHFLLRRPGLRRAG
jgi:cyclopropane fatty-acyl-phospholipid synthase-like methyltransferase